jgi:hypothetical protein
LNQVEVELVAQSVEQRTFNAWVVGSIPTELTTSRSYRAPGGQGSPRCLIRRSLPVPYHARQSA